MPADQVARRPRDSQADACISFVQFFGGVCADVAAGHRVPAFRREHDPVAAESIDHQSTHGAAARADGEPTSFQIGFRPARRSVCLYIRAGLRRR